MIIQKCDICNRECLISGTIVIYKRYIDFCFSCKGEAEKIKESFKKEIDFEFSILDSRLRSKENKMINNAKDKNREKIYFAKKGEQKK